MDVDSDFEKKSKPKAPLKRIRTIVVKKKTTMKRADTIAPTELTLHVNKRKLKRLQSQNIEPKSNRVAIWLKLLFFAFISLL